MTWKKWSPVDDPGDVRPVKDSLGTVARQLGLESTAVVVSVFGEWETVVGPVLAAHSRPDRLRDGELVVVVDEPAWATELRFASGEIASRINEQRGSTVVTSIVVSVQRPSGSAAEPGSRTRRWAQANHASDQGVDRGVDRASDRGVDRGVDRGTNRGTNRGDRTRNQPADRVPNAPSDALSNSPSNSPSNSRSKRPAEPPDTAMRSSRPGRRTDPDQGPR